MDELIGLLAEASTEARAQQAQQQEAQTQVCACFLLLAWLAVAALTADPRTHRADHSVIDTAQLHQVSQLESHLLSIFL
jgi:hypothetical protein